MSYTAARIIGYLIGSLAPFFLALIWAIFLVAMAVYASPVLLALFLYAKKLHGAEFKAWKFLRGRFKDWRLQMTIFGIGVSVTLLLLSIENSQWLSAFMFLGLLLLVSYFPYRLISEKPMNPYLSMIGGGGIEEVKNRVEAAPPAVELVVPPDLAERLNRRIIGQKPVLDELSAAVLRRARLRRPNKPIFVAMLVGATGAGKTETAKALAEACNVELTRFDMNEFTESHSTQRLVGSPPGYRDSELGGQLTRAIHNLGAGVLLFDEIEKAHEDVMKVLMGLLDEGRMTEASSGMTVNASNFIIVATSNAEYEKVAEIAATMPHGDERAAKITDTLKKVWSPDKLARFDAILPFAPLDFEARVSLIVLQLMQFARECGLEIEQGGIEPAAVAEAVRLAELRAGTGVRGLKRAIEAQAMDSMLELKERRVKRIAIRVIEGRIVAVAGQEQGGRADGR